MTQNKHKKWEKNIIIKYIHPLIQKKETNKEYKERNFNGLQKE